MDVLSIRRVRLPPVKEFDEKVLIRAEQHEHRRGRNNVTSCRSPTRQFDTRFMKNELKEKRHLEFLRRRSVSPELCGMERRNYSPKAFYRSSNKSEISSNFQLTRPANGHPVTTPSSSRSDVPGTSKWSSSWSDQVTLMSQEKGQARKQQPSTKQVIKKSNEAKYTDKSENRINGQQTSIRSLIQTEKIYSKFSTQTENILQRKATKEANVQTESGLVLIKESDVRRLAEYLQEALLREEALRKKLAALQESTSNLMNSSGEIWTARYSEDLLRNQIKALEAQLQVCLQKFPKDAVKKLLLQMEKQKLEYEEKAMVALQKATQEKTEALSKAETLQEVLITARADTLRWQRLYEELKLSSGQIREQQHLSDQQLQQLRSQSELFRAREAELREEVVALRQERKELQYNVCLLEEDQQILRDEIQQIRDGSNECQDLMMQRFVTSAEAEAREAVKRDSQVEEKLRHTQEKLGLKEKECEELQTELHAMELECQSSQIRLSQCRDELRQLSHRRRRPTPCVSWWRVFVFLLLLLAVSGVAMLWLWHPPFREQVEDLYADIETRIEDYLMQMACSKHSGSFRPV